VNPDLELYQTTRHRAHLSKSLCVARQSWQLPKIVTRTLFPPLRVIVFFPVKPNPRVMMGNSPERRVSRRAEAGAAACRD
jgi:hypothetical protein